jgi:cytochrome c nitrite reductase small subunit
LQARARPITPLVTSTDGHVVILYGTSFDGRLSGFDFSRGLFLTGTGKCVAYLDRPGDTPPWGTPYPRSTEEIWHWPCAGMKMKVPRWLRTALIIVAAIGAAAGAGGAGLWLASDRPAFCATCHVIEPYYRSWVDSDLLAHAHAQAGVVCKGCHRASVLEAGREAVVYILGRYENPLEERRIPKEQCYACHEHGSYEQIIALTRYLEAEVGANPHDAHFGDMGCHICHKMHRPFEDFCTECHSFGWDGP